MSNSTLSVEAQRDIVEAMVRELNDRGRFKPFGDGHGGVIANAYQALQYLKSAGPAGVEAVQRALNIVEDQAITDDRRAAVEEERQANEDAKGGPMTELEEQARQEQLARAVSIAAYERSTEGRLEKIEDVLIEIRDALKSR